MNRGAWWATVPGVAEEWDEAQQVTVLIEDSREFRCSCFPSNSRTMNMCVCSVAQLCLTLCDPVDCSLPGFSVHGILWTRILEWGVIAFSRRWRLWKVALFLLDILIPLPSQQLCSYKCPVFAWTFALFLPT